MSRSLTLFALSLAVLACGDPQPEPVTIDGWCVAMETAMRDRQARCACDGTPATDEQITARCASLSATSLLEAFGADAVGWHSTIARAHVERLDGCEPVSPLVIQSDDPVVGAAMPGDPCRIFADAWGAPDDCAYGARCVERGGEARCAAIASEGEACDDAALCEGTTTCTGGVCACAGASCDDAAVCPPAIVVD
jgi:hypothetical protein